MERFGLALSIAGRFDLQKIIYPDVGCYVAGSGAHARTHSSYCQCAALQAMVLSRPKRVAATHLRPGRERANCNCSLPLSFSRHR
jgi:hypothetical protein